jgi:hypothetical protein
LTGQPNPPRLHRLGDILQRLRSHIVTGNLDLASHLSMGVIGYADTSRFGNALKARSNVDAVPKDIVVIDDDVTDVDADAKFDPVVVRHGRVLLGHPALDLYGASDRIHGTSKLDQDAIAGRLDDPAAIGGDGGTDERFPDSLEPSQRAFLIYAHETAVPGDIRCQHRCQTPFHAFGGQGIPLDLQFQPSPSKHIGALLD